MVTMQLPQVLSELAEFNLRRFGEYTMVYYEGQTYTNTQLADQARRLAAGLKAQGVKPGDRVIVMLVNSPEVMVAYQAIARLGAVAVPLLPVLKTSEIQHIAANCQPRAFITNFALNPVIQPALEAAGLSVPAVIVAIGDPEQIQAVGLISYTELLANAEPLYEVAQCQPEDLAIILYTSGTTGTPKGVMLSHHNQMHNLMSVADPDYLLGNTTRAQEPFLVPLPMAHAFGLLVANLSLLGDDPLILMPRFETQKAFELIEKYRVYKMPAVPAMLVAMLNYPDADRYDISSLNNVTSGSAPLPESVLFGFQKRFGAIIREGYGLTEATTAVSGHHPDMVIKPGSVGKANEGNEVRIVDLENQPLPPGERGEVVVRGGNIMMGYYQNPEATANAITDGWLHTGDVGYLDEDGYLYIVARIKDLIIRGGQNVYPRDAEEVLGQHPAVLEVAVVGIPSELYGEEVKAFVTLRPDQQVTAAELLDFCKQSLANYKIPAYIEFVEALPRNTVGKINKRALRDLSNR